MTARHSPSVGNRSLSPSAKFYSRSYCKENTTHAEDHGPESRDSAVSAPHPKRRKLDPSSEKEGTADVESTCNLAPSPGLSQSSDANRDFAKPKRTIDGGAGGSRVSRSSSGIPSTKRPSSLNLHNYPVNRHPVGIAIWVIQKIDSARREGNGSISSRDSSPERGPLPASSAGSVQISRQTPDCEEDGDPLDRRQSQRERKIKQRLENWAKSTHSDATNSLLLIPSAPPSPSPACNLD